MYQRYIEIYFTTATILEWKHLLRNNEMKEIIIDSFRYLVKEQRAIIYGFVIMPNHIHIVWHIRDHYTLTEVKSALLSFTAHQFKKILVAKASPELEKYRVNLKDRTFQFWERNALSVAIYHDDVFYQKMRYIHLNPCTEKWQLAAAPDLYKYSSAYKQEEGGYWDFVAY